MKKIYMKRMIFGMLLMLFGAVANAQISNPVKWSYTATKIADKTYEIHLTASIDGNWHLYAQDAGEGPEPTTIAFTPNPLLSFEGKVKEVGKMEKSYDKNFNSVLKFYGKKVDFVQKVKLKSPIATVVKGSVTFMVCNDRQCLPPRDVPFSINISGK
jgi:DsbC/DsbD-like thiol-disulfide interchange protein